MTEKQISYEGKRIVYRTSGKGRPVMLIHGFGETASVWNNQVSVISERHRLIIPDLPGSGSSEMIADMSMEGMAEIMHEIIHAEGIDRCTVIGHSMGGYVTLALAEKYWNHLDAFGLFHSTAFADSEEKKETRRKGIAFMEQHGGPAFLATSSPNLFSTVTKEENPGLVKDFLASLSNFSTPPLVSYYAAMMKRPDRTTVLKDNPLPVLFVLGKYDVAVPLEDGLKLCHLPENAYIHVLQQSGHLGMLEEAGESTRLLNEFLNRTSQF